MARDFSKFAPGRPDRRSSALAAVTIRVLIERRIRVVFALFVFIHTGTSFTGCSHDDHNKIDLLHFALLYREPHCVQVACAKDAQFSASDLRCDKDRTLNPTMFPRPGVVRQISASQTLNLVLTAIFCDDAHSPLPPSRLSSCADRSVVLHTYAFFDFLGPNAGVFIYFHGVNCRPSFITGHGYGPVPQWGDDVYASMDNAFRERFTPFWQENFFAPIGVALDATVVKCIFGR